MHVGVSFSEMPHMHVGVSFSAMPPQVLFLLCSALQACNHIQYDSSRDFQVHTNSFSVFHHCFFSSPLIFFEFWLLLGKEVLVIQLTDIKGLCLSLEFSHLFHIYDVVGLVHSPTTQPRFSNCNISYFGAYTSCAIWYLNPKFKRYVHRCNASSSPHLPLNA